MSSYSNKGRSSLRSYIIVGGFICLMVLIGLGKDKIAARVGDFFGADKDHIEKVLIEIIQEKPELIIEAVNSGQRNMQKKMIEQISKNAKEGVVELAKSDFSPMAGNKDGNVTIYYFYDANCGYCKMANGTIDKLLTEDSNVKIVYKPFPILGQDSRDVAKASAAVYMIDPSKYENFHQKIMQSGKANLQSAYDAAKTLDISKAQLDEYMAKPEAQKKIDDVMLISKKIGINAAPAFIIGDEYVPGALDLDGFKEVIKKQRGEK